MEITFVTGIFDLTSPGTLVYGGDAAAWIRTKLHEIGIEGTEPVQEDWGWYMTVVYDDNGYILSFTGKGEGDDEEQPNLGVWILLFDKYRTRMQQLLRQNKLDGEDPVLTQVIRVLQEEKQITYIGAK